MRNYTLLFLVMIASSACQTNYTPEAKSVDTPKEEVPKIISYGDTVEVAHGKPAFMKKKAVKFDLNLMFGGKERLNGTLTLLTNSAAGRVDYKDGRILVYNQGEVFYSEGFTPEQASFAAYTWSYFFMLPYKLTDEGTVLNATNINKLDGIEYNSKKLTFKAETGASPKDWYLLYVDKNTHLLRAAAYIVTAKGKSVEEAEKDPHAIEYLNYKTIDGISTATEWKFWGWQPDAGFTKQLGEAKLSNYSYIEPNDALFQKTDSLTAVQSF